MLSKELIEKAWKSLPTNKQSVIATLDNASKNVVSEMRNNPQHTLQYYNALSFLLDKVIVEIASRNCIKEYLRCSRRMVLLIRGYQQECSLVYPSCF